LATNTKDIKINIDVVDNNTKQALRNLLTEVNSALKTAAPTGNPAFNNYIKNLKKTVADFRVELTAAFKDIEKMKLNPPMSPQKSTTRIKNMEGGFRDVTSYTMGVDSSKFDPLIKKVNSLSSSIKELVDTVKKIGQIPNESLSGLTKGLDKSLRKPTRSLVEEYKKMGKQQVDAIIRNNELERQAYANSPEGTFNKKVQSIQDGINKSKTMLKLYHDWLKTKNTFRHTLRHSLKFSPKVCHSNFNFF
jgi:molecular chaperone DnaK (HSP70)